MLSYFTGHCLKVNAYICEVGRERNANNEWRWVLPYPNPCECTSVIMGGVNTWTPIRPFVPVYVLSPLLSNNIEAIRTHYGLECDEKSKLSYIKIMINHQNLFDVHFLKGVLHLLPKISMFCALSQNNQHLLEKQHNASHSKLSKELKNGIEIWVGLGQAVFKLWIKTVKIWFGSITQELLGLP